MSRGAAKGFDPKGPLDPSRALVPAVIKVNTQMVKRGFWPKIRRVARAIPFADDVVALWFCAKDGATPAGTKAMLMAALAYFVLPTDVLPDWFVGLGFTDDAAVIAAAIAAVAGSITIEHRERARKAMTEL